MQGPPPPAPAFFSALDPTFSPSCILPDSFWGLNAEGPGPHVHLVDLSCTSAWQEVANGD